MICFLYVIALTAALGLAAAALEPVLPAHAPRRWLWCGAIALAMSMPAIYQAKHNVTVGPALAGIAARDDLLIEVWNTASLGLLLWGVASVLLVSYAVHAARRDRGSEVIDGVPVVVTDRLGPATVGFWRARVLVPGWVMRLPSAQRRYVVRHEEEHRINHDGRVLFIASLAVIVVPWNIAMWWLLRRLALAVEVDCDRRVVAALGDPHGYGELLLDVAQAGHHTPRLQPGFLGGAGALERRLRALVAPTRLSTAWRYVLPAIAFALLLAALLAPHPVTGAH